MERKILLVAHGDLDGVISAVLLIEKICHQKNIGQDEMLNQLRIKFAQPFHLERVEIPTAIEEIYVVDIGINNQDPFQTEDFIRKTGTKLIRWYDHHRGWLAFLSKMPGEVRDKFVIDENALACASIINTSNKLTKDAIAADTREIELSKTGQLIIQAIKSNRGDDSIKMFAVMYLLGDERWQNLLEESASRYREVQLPATLKLVKQNCRIENGIAVVDVRNTTEPFDRALLSVMAKRLSPKKTVIILRKGGRGEEIDIFTSLTIDLMEIFGLSGGGHSNRISIPAIAWTPDGAIRRLKEAISKNNP